MARSLIGSSLTAALFFVSSAGLHAQTSTAPMIETASLIGASVFAADGTLVGEVADVLVIDRERDRNLSQEAPVLSQCGQRRWLMVPDEPFDSCLYRRVLLKRRALF